MPRNSAIERTPVAEHYRDLASRYDDRWSSYLEASLALTLTAITPDPGDRLLDVGCGTGSLLERLHAAHPFLTLCGCDPTSEMLAIAESRLPDPSRLVKGIAKSLPFADESFDWVVSSSVLHHVSVPMRALAEATRVLRPGGHLVLTDWCRDFATMKLLDAYLRISHPAHVRAYSSEEILGLMRASGLRNLTLTKKRTSWFWGLMLATGLR